MARFVIKRIATVQRWIGFRTDETVFMFVILLMMFWVQRPLTFSASWRRALITTAILLVALIPTGLLGIEGLIDGAFQTSAVYAQSPGSPSSGSSLSPNGKPFGRDALQPNGGAQQGSQIGQSRPSFAPGPGKRLREGTLVPATVGQFEMIGRRWMFSSQLGSRPTNGSRNANDGYVNSSTGRSISRQEVERATDEALYSDGLLNRTTSLTYTEATADRRETSVRQLPDLLLVENLMLQRIVEAVREDSEDNRWEITGVVTEFFDENRLTILTAKRAAQLR